MLGIVAVALILRRAKILNSEHGDLFAKVVLNVTLPALIFHSLYHAKIEARLFGLVGIMIAAQLTCYLLAYATGRVLKLSKGKLGALMLTSAFGSSGLLGYALIAQAFPGNSEAMTAAAMISEMAVAPLVFTVGVVTAIHFGNTGSQAKAGLKSILKFLRSPVFIALTAGLICSLVGMPKATGVVKVFFNGLETVASANTFLAAMIVGLLLNYQSLRSAAGVIAAACLIKLIIQPVLVWLPTTIFDVSSLHQQVLVIEAAMPAMTLSVVFAKAYGCDAKSTSVSLLATNVASVITLIGVNSALL